MCLDLPRFILNKPSIQYRGFPTGYWIFQASLHIWVESIFKSIHPCMTKNQFLYKLRIERLRLNPTLPGWEGNKSLLRLAGTFMCNHRQTSNYPGQYLCYGQGILPAPMGLIGTQGTNLSPTDFTLLCPQKDLRPASPAPAGIRSRQIHLHSFPRTQNRSSEEFTLSKIQVGTSTRLRFFRKEIN